MALRGTRILANDVVRFEAQWPRRALGFHWCNLTAAAGILMVQRRLRFRTMAQGLFALVLTAATICASAQTTLVEPPTPLLPEKFGSWQAEATAAPAESFQPQGESSAVLKEAGLIRSGRRAYRKGAETMSVEAYQFGDATGAFSAFTYLRSPAMKGLPGERSSASETVTTPDGEFLVWRGGTVVRADVSRVHSSTNDDLRQLALTLPKISGPKAIPPGLPTLLPPKGLQQDSIRYAVGPIGYKAMGGMLPSEHLGFEKSSEVVWGRYAGQGTLSLVMLPTPQIAGDRGRGLAADLTQQGDAAGTVKLRREGPLLLVTTGAWSAADAKAAVENTHLRNEVTWNKAVPPEFHAEVKKTVSLLTSILIFCGLGALAALVLGLFFGGGRAAIRVLQGKPAATEPEFVHIDLSGRVKPIHSDSPSGGSKS
jgi:hypothetical protein